MVSRVAYLNQVLSFCLCNERLKLWCREGIDKTCLGDNKKKDLGASQDGQFISLCRSGQLLSLRKETRFTRCRVPSSESTDLLHDAGLALGESNMTARLVGDELDLDLSSLATWLIVIVVVVVCSGRTRALDTAIIAGWNN